MRMKSMRRSMGENSPTGNVRLFRLTARSKRPWGISGGPPAFLGRPSPPPAEKSLVDTVLRGQGLSFALALPFFRTSDNSELSYWVERHSLDAVRPSVGKSRIRSIARME